MWKIFYYSICFYVFFISCKENITDADDFESLETNVRMEIQILDSTYQLYSRPYTNIFFTTYLLGADGDIFNFEQSDTTSCPNGWGVKLLNFTFNNREEKIILGAACEAYEGPNYREMTITYEEALRRTDSLNHASMKKTFAIYYK